MIFGINEGGKIMYADAVSTAIANLIIFLLIVLFRKEFHNEKLDSFLIHVDRTGKKLFLEGAAVGIVFFMLYALIVVLSGKGKLVFNMNNSLITLKMLFFKAIACMTIALVEEALFRGYILQRVLKKFPKWISILITAAIFGLLHFSSYSSSYYFWIGIINAIFIGIMLSLIVIKTNSLMLAMGYHFTWNLTQNMLFSKSRHNVGAILNLKMKDSLWTGNAFTPESGILVTFIIVIIYFYIIVRFKNSNKYCCDYVN